MTLPEKPLQLLWIKPPGFIHAEALRDAIDSIRHGLLDLGIDAPLTENVALANHTPIIFGAHLLGPEEEERIPPDAILYNLEQFAHGYAGTAPRYCDLLSRFRVWDASSENVAYLRAWGINAAAQHVPLGYAPQLTRIVRDAADEDIDVLFFGLISPRRQAVLEQLEQRGLRVTALNGVFGRALDEYVARAKVVVNIRFGEQGGLEFPRLLYLLANGKTVVSEEARETGASGLAPGIVEVPYGGLSEACLELCRDAERRRVLGAEALAAATALGTSGAALRRAMDALPAARPRGDRAIVPPRLPRTLNLGSGKNFRPWCLNWDSDAQWAPDFVRDACLPIAPETSVATTRFGEIELRSGMFDTVIADHLLEHLVDLPAAMHNVLTLLSEGGSLYAEVPYDLSYGAWQDPRHVRAFNERSWLYYTDWHWYLGWKEARFDLAGLSFGLSSVGLNLAAGGMALAEVLLRPRAVDVMRVHLRKRSLSTAPPDRAPQERQ